MGRLIYSSYSYYVQIFLDAQRTYLVRDLSIQGWRESGAGMEIERFSMLQAMFSVSEFSGRVQLWPALATDCTSSLSFPTWLASLEFFEGEIISGHIQAGDKILHGLEQVCIFLEQQHPLSYTWEPAPANMPAPLYSEPIVAPFLPGPASQTDSPPQARPSPMQQTTRSDRLVRQSASASTEWKPRRTNLGETFVSKRTTLPRDQWRVLVLCDGTKTLAEIRNQLGVGIRISDEVLYQILQSLILQKLLLEQ